MNSQIIESTQPNEPGKVLHWGDEWVCVITVAGQQHLAQVGRAEATRLLAEWHDGGVRDCHHELPADDGE